jgi:hypothetical protein
MKRRSWLAGATVALLAGLNRQAAAQKPGDIGYPYGDLKEVTLQGRLLPLGDLVARKYGARLQGAGPERQMALVLPEGQLYTFLDNEAYRKLTATMASGAPVSVKARQFPRSMLLEVLEASSTPEEALKRRFFCDICVLYTEEFGPCVCCGKEMQPLRAGE